ncbi:sulfate transporter [Desulfosarcina ovata subsp. sediminis]|uniref:Sulfate transporter n=2 Tax=Desulfosarcina ovata TaxID=83564 RepID=A0A5K7ZW68_9BACT|nr:sulfate transporter [Desulfosarcina ovata subsp. sediminis]
MALKNDDGHWIDGAGNAVPVKYVGQFDKMSDRVVGKLSRRAKQLSEQLANFKGDIFAEIDSLITEMKALYGEDHRTDVGNKVLSDFSNTLKVEIKVNKILEFDQRISLAKEIIDECIKRWSKGGDEKVKLLVDHAFQVDKKGNLDRDRLLSLRKLEIRDTDWRKAMDIIADSLKVTGARSYVRFLAKDDSGMWRTVPLDIAQL